MKFAYIRECQHYGYFIFEGLPENHKDNKCIGKGFFTRRMAKRYLKNHGYELVLRNPDGTYYTEIKVKIPLPD